MKRGLRMAVATVLAASAWSTSAAQRPVESSATDVVPPVAIRTSLSRTAVWIGDHVIYSLELRCAPNFDILLDDLSGERLHIDGGELISAEADHEITAAGLVRRMRYTLSTYRVDVPELRIREMPVRYFEKRGDGTAAETPAGEVKVPGAAVAIRSTLPDTGPMPVRHPGELRRVPRSIRLAQPLGLVLIAVAAAPLAFAMLDVAGRARRAWDSRAARRLRKEQSGSLEGLKALDTSSEGARIAAFDQLDGLIRDRLQLSAGVNAHALTPAELRRELERRRAALPHEAIAALLDLCESARYAPEPPFQSDWERALREAEQIVAATR